VVFSVLPLIRYGFLKPTVSPSDSVWKLSLASFAPILLKSLLFWGEQIAGRGRGFSFAASGLFFAPIARPGGTIKVLQNLDARSEYMLGGRWLSEDHPLVLAELQRTRTNC
jgi:hypothetical protein